MYKFKDASLNLLHQKLASDSYLGRIGINDTFLFCVFKKFSNVSLNQPFINSTLLFTLGK